MRPPRPASARLRPALAAALLGLATAAAAQDPGDGDTLLIADEAVHDERAGVTTAAGAVELSRGARVLRADRLRYDRRADAVTAEGGVALIEPGGDTLFADRAKLSGDLKSGEVSKAGVLFTDGSRLAAAGGRRTVDGKTDLARAVYSPCEPCEDDPDGAPLWRLRAARVAHDPDDKTLTYGDAWFDLFGLPVFYTPYYSHPDPTVRRETGFLTPSFGQSSVFGFFWRQPLFLVLSPHADATLTPIYIRRGRPILTAQYREATRTGEWRLEGSLARETLLPDDPALNDRWRGHFNLVGDFDLGRRRGMRWRSGFAIAQATDATYPLRYDLGAGPTPEQGATAVSGLGGRGGEILGFARGLPFLARNVYLRGRAPGTTATLDAWSFRGFDPGADSGKSPIAAPVAEVRWRGEPGFAGGAWSLHGAARALTRPRGADSRLVSAEIGWRAPFATRLGDRYALGASLRADGYRLADLADPEDPDAAGEAWAARVLPQVALDWRWPWVRPGDSWSFFIEPRAKLVLAPNGGNPAPIPNDDSLAFEFDEIGLFEDNRFPGLDRVESGVRAAWALRAGGVAEAGPGVELLVGQAWRKRADDAYEAGVGLEDRFSDHVGRLVVRPAPWLDLTARFRLDRKGLAVRRGSLTAAAGPDWLRAALSYIRLANAAPTTGAPEPASQIDGSVSWRFARYWRVSAAHQRDLGANGGALRTGGGVFYEDECLSAGIELARNFTRRHDVEASTSVMFQVRLRNLD